MFLNASRHLTPKHDIEQIASSTLHTNLLGEHVAHAWGVGQVLVWAPSAPAEKLAGGKTSKELLRTAGLYKVQGEAVQAIVGGVYQQYVRACVSLFFPSSHDIACRVGLSPIGYSTHGYYPFYV